MAHVKTALGASILAHALALAAIGVLAPNGMKAVEEALTPVELVTLQEAGRMTHQAEPVPIKKIEETRQRQSVAARPAPAQAHEAEEKSEPLPGPVAAAALPVQRAQVPESAPVHKHAEAQAVSAFVKAEDDDRPAKAARDLDAAFNSYVIQKIDRAKRYPNWARQRGYEGNVMVSFKVAPDGTVSSLKVVGPCECDILNKAACEAIERAAPFSGGPEPEKKVREIRVSVGFKLEK